MTERKWTPVIDAEYMEANIVEDDGNIIATIFMDSRTPEHAHLIAASKKLYEALICQDPFNEGINNDNPNKRENESSQEYGERLSCAALAKARGET